MESIHFHRGLALSLSKGFTLVELLVVLAIIGVISVTTLNSQGSFNKTLILSNTAYDIALTLRSAETFGLGSRASDGAVNAGYGIHFQTGNSFTLFTDIYPASSDLPFSCHPQEDEDAPDALPGNCLYDATHSEKVKDYTLGNGITINALYANGISVDSLDIVFARPNPDAFISTDGSYSLSNTSACLVIASSNAPSGPYRYIKVESSGAITANATSCL